MNKLSQLATFIEVVDAGGFAAAAKKLGISTAAVSRQITQLEKNLGAQLLQRTTRRLNLTELGAQYYGLCKTTLQSLNEAEDLIAGSREEASGILHVMSNRFFAIKHLLPRLPEFMRENPNLRVNFALAERFPDLAKEGVDILFGVSIDGPAELVRKRVATTRYVLCAAPTYLEKFGVPQKPADLSQHCYIAHSIRQPKDVLTFNNGEKIKIEARLMMNDARAMRDCALSGMGIVRLHDYMVSSALDDGRLIEVLAELHQTTIPIYLYYQPSRYLQPKIRKFIDFYTL